MSSPCMHIHCTYVRVDASRALCEGLLCLCLYVCARVCPTHHLHAADTSPVLETGLLRAFESLRAKRAAATPPHPG